MLPRVAIAISAACVLAGAGWSFASKSGPVAKADAAVSAAAVDHSQQYVDITDKQAGGFNVAPAETREFKILANAVGSIDFNENMLVQSFSTYSGKIVDIFFSLGDEVKRGQPLFTIDSPDLLQAESTLLATAGVFEFQSRTLNRVKQLLKTGGGAQRDVDQATSDQQTAEGNYKAARDAVRIFGKNDTEIDQIVADRKVDSILTVPSPIDGRVVARNAAPGLYVQPGTAPAPFTLADLSTMWMVAYVTETEAPAYKLGQPVEVRVPAYPDEVFRGHVTALGANIDPVSHRQLVRSVIDDPKHELRSGMLARFTTEIQSPVQSVAVPLEAIVREGDGTMTIWTTIDSRRFIRRQVSIGLAQNGWRQITDGLRAGDMIATTGAVFLSNKFANAATD